MTNKMIVVHDEIDLPIGSIKIAYDQGRWWAQWYKIYQSLLWR